MNSNKRLFCGIAAVIISPVIAAAAVNFSPNVEDLVLLSQQSLFTKEKVEISGNGDLLLYVPKENADPKINEDDSEETRVKEEKEIKQESENENCNAEEEPEVTQAASLSTTEPVPEYTPGISAAETQIFDGSDSALLISQNISEETEDLSVFSNVSGAIERTTFTSVEGSKFITMESGAQVRNETDLSREFVESETHKPSFVYVDTDSGEPQVLIMHTHTSESYEISEKDFYDANYTCRTIDSQKSVVAVGTAIAEELASAGICTLHDGTIHDSPSYNGAYARSSATISQILNEYPSIKIILDIHRDAIEEADGTRVAAVSEADGKDAAQMMIISAADDGTYDIPNYLENFHFACALQNKMENNYPGITRPILFQYCQYNQQFTPGSLLIEVGSHGNTLSEAVYTGRLIGISLAQLLKGT